MIIPCLPEPADRGSLKQYAALIAACRKAGKVTCACLTDEAPQPGAIERFSVGLEKAIVIPISLQSWRSLISQMCDPLPPNIRHWMDPEACGRLAEALRDIRPDLVVLGDLVMIPYADAAKVLDRPFWIVRSRVDAVFQDLVQRQGPQSLRGRIQYLLHRFRIRRYEQMAARRCRGEIVCAPSDRDGLREIIGSTVRIEVVANGIERAEFPDQGALPAEPMVLFPGTFDYEPNIDGAHWFVETIWPQVRIRYPDAQLFLVGRSPIASILALAGHDGITVTGSVESMLPWYQRARCVVCPIRIGGGTRLKVVEAWAVGRPQVATTIAVDGLDARDDQNCLIRDEPDGFAQAICRLLSDGALADRIRADSLSTSESYAWDYLMAPVTRMMSEQTS